MRKPIKTKRRARLHLRTATEITRRKIIRAGIARDEPQGLVNTDPLGFLADDDGQFRLPIDPLRQRGTSDHRLMANGADAGRLDEMPRFLSRQLRVFVPTLLIVPRHFQHMATVVCTGAIHGSKGAKRRKQAQAVQTGAAGKSQTLEARQTVRSVLKAMK